MLNKLSYNLMNELNEADTNAIEIKKKVFMEGSNVRVEEIPAEEANLEKQQINESEEVKGKEVLNELGTDSTIDKLIAGDELYFRNNDGLALMVRYADTYDQPEDYDEGYIQGWERGADEEFDKVQDENFAKAKQAAEEGNVWEVLEIDETTLQPNGSVYGYLYGQEELAKFLKEVREVRVVKRLEESKKICEKCGKEVCECDKSINESGEDIKKDLNKGKMNEAAPINSDLKKGKEDRLASLKTQLEADGDQLSDDEKKAIEDEIAQLEKEVYTESTINEAESLMEFTNGFNFDAFADYMEKEIIKIYPSAKFKRNYSNGHYLAVYLGNNDTSRFIIEAFINTNDDGSLNDGAIQVTYPYTLHYSSEDLNTISNNWTGNSNSAHFKIDEINKALEMIKFICDKFQKTDLDENNIEFIEEAEKEHRIMDGNKVIKKFKDNEFEKGYNEMRDMGKKLKADGKEDNLIYKTVTIKNINETGEWDNNDEDMQMWLEDLRDQAKELAAKVKGEVKSVTGFDAYQGPRAIVHTPKHGDIEMWYDQEDDRGLTFSCKVAHVGWINGGINQLAEILNQDTIDDNEIISESEDIKPHKKADRQFIIALIKSGALDDIDTLKKEGGFEDAVDYWVNHYYDDYTDAELKDLDETAKSADDKLHEAEVSNLKTIKSQGNIFMLEDDNQYIVGENYNEPENIIENAEIYSTKEEADKDYFNRCGITLEESVEEKDLSKDLFGSEAEKRQSEADRALEKYLDLAREIKAGNNDTITLDSAKQLLKNAYIKAKGYYSFEPEEIDRRIAKDIPDLFGDLEEGVISDLKATHLAKKAAKLSKEKDFNKSTKAFAKSIEINDKSANKLDNKAKKLEDKAGKLRNEAIVKRHKSVKDFTSKK